MAPWDDGGAREALVALRLHRSGAPVADAAVRLVVRDGRGRALGAAQAAPHDDGAPGTYPLRVVLTEDDHELHWSVVARGAQGLGFRRYEFVRRLSQAECPN